MVGYSPAPRPDHVPRSRARLATAGWSAGSVTAPVHSAGAGGATRRGVTGVLVPHFDVDGHRRAIGQAEISWFLVARRGRAGDGGPPARPLPGQWRCSAGAAGRRPAPALGTATTPR